MQPFFLQMTNDVIIIPHDGTDRVISLVIVGYIKAVENLKKYQNKKMSRSAILTNRINL
jgi:hypothetical protein